MHSARDCQSGINCTAPRLTLVFFLSSPFRMRKPEALDEGQILSGCDCDLVALLLPTGHVNQVRRPADNVNVLSGLKII